MILLYKNLYFNTMEDKTKKIISIVAAMLVVAASAIGIGYKLWYGEDMPVVTDNAVVETVDTVNVTETVVDTVVAPDTVVAQF